MAEISWDLKTTDELMKSLDDDWGVETFWKALNTYKELTQAASDAEWVREQRMNVRDGYINTAIQDTIGAYNQNKNDIDAANTAVKSLENILNNTRVNDPNRPIVHSARASYNYLKKEQEELIQVQSILNNVASDNDGMYSEHSFYDIPNQLIKNDKGEMVDWTVESGVSSATMMQIDEGLTWIQNHKRTLYTAGRLDGETKLRLEEKENELKAMKSFAKGHDGFISPKDAEYIRQGRELNTVLNSMQTDYTNTEITIGSKQREKRTIEGKIQNKANWYAGTRTGDPPSPTEQATFPTSYDMERLPLLNEEIQVLQNKSADYAEFIKRHEYDYTGVGDPYTETDDIYGYKATLEPTTKEDLKEAGVKKPLAVSTETMAELVEKYNAQSGRDLPLDQTEYSKGDLLAFLGETFVKDISGVKIFRGDQEIEGAEDYLDDESRNWLNLALTKWLGPTGNIDEFEGSFDTKTGSIYDKDGKHIGKVTDKKALLNINNQIEMGKILKDSSLTYVKIDKSSLAPALDDFPEGKKGSKRYKRIAKELSIVIKKYGEAKELSEKKKILGKIKRYDSYLKRIAKQ